MTRVHLARIGFNFFIVQLLLGTLTAYAAANSGVSTDDVKKIPSSVMVWRKSSISCGWSEVFDALHPERPPRLLPVEKESNCDVKVRKMSTVVAGEKVSMVYVTSDSQASIRVIALEAGSVGEVIRCRSSIDGAVLVGRISDTQTVELLGRDGKVAW